MYIIRYTVFFLTHNSVFVLLASTRQERHNFDYWIPTIYQFGGDSPIIIGQTCHDGNEVAWNDLNIYLGKPEFNIIKTNLHPYYSLNLKRNNQGLSSIKKVIISQLTELPHCKKDVPKSWLNVRERLKEEANKHACISFDFFKQICDSVAPASFYDEVDYTDCCEFFYNIGVLLWYSQNPILKDWVILQPDWAMRAVYKIIDDEKVQKRKGHIIADDFNRLWKEKTYRDKQFILKEMLSVFKVAFPKKHKSEDYIIPARLISIPVEKIWTYDARECLVIEYYFDFMPRGLLNQVSAELSRYIVLDEENEEEIWNNAVNFKYNEACCQMNEDFFNKKINIVSRGKDARGLVILIKETLENAISHFKGVKYDIYVPCSCSECRNGENVTKYKYADLLRREQKGKKDVRCNESDESLMIDDLLYNAGLFSDIHLINRPMNDLTIITIFLASSSELEPDRKDFEIFINRENKELINRGIFLRLELWEDFINAMSKTRLQDKYNEAVRESDIFVSLFYSKVGKYTEEEFNTAWGQFKDNQKPYIYTYFKKGAAINEISEEDILSLLNFKKMLKKLEHFQTEYNDINDLKYQFKVQLEKVLPKLTI